MATSDYLEQVIIDYFLNSNGEFSTTSPANVYVALYTAAPSDSGGGTEVSGGSYARVDTGAFTAMTGITDGQTENTTEIAFTQATASWGEVTSIGLHDHISAGNLLYHGTLTANKTVDIDDTFKIAAGDLVITLT